jgi:hypothetical protein
MTGLNRLQGKAVCDKVLEQNLSKLDNKSTSTSLEELPSVPQPLEQPSSPPPPYTAFSLRYRCI